MKRANIFTAVRAGVLASSVLLLPPTLPTFAQTTTPTPATRQVATRDDRGKVGLWGLLGLVGLAGLAGLRRRPGTVGVYTNPNPREQDRT